MDYRERCYKNFVSKHWNYSHTLSKEAYDHFATVSRKRFRNILPKNKEAKILDIACGTGHFLSFLQGEGYMNAQGIDFSEEQIEIAKIRGVKNIKKADLFEYLPLNYEAFDVIVAKDIIEHLRREEVLEFLDLIYDSLIEGGKVILPTVNARSLFGAGIVFIDLTHEIGFTPESLSQVLRVCNFKDVRVYGEKPIPHDFRSAVRSGLWWLLLRIFKFYIYVEQGTGRGLWRNYHIFEPRFFAVGTKPKS
jgi:2-polyprenyl-3-methyl-5-hydroxy-6-metoxy-1,4-benzoquinol methylase